MRIAIIDSGIDASNPQFKTNVAFQCSIDMNDYKSTNCAQDRLGHGTACADIILRYCPSAKLYIFKIYENALVTYPDKLIYALKECQKIGVDIINLSLGMVSKSYYKELHDICKKLVDNGSIIIAAGSENDVLACWPAEFPFVVKVISDETCSKSGYSFYDQPSLMVSAYGGREFVRGIGSSKTIVWGNSFACARVTGLIAKQIGNDHMFMSVHELHLFLKEHADEVHPSSNTIITANTCIRQPLTGKQVVIYPFNKEMHSIVRFSELLRLQIVAVVDFPFSKHVKKDIGQCIGLESQGLTIETSFEQALQTRADTVILGDLSEVSRIHKKDYLEKCVKKAFDANKNVITIELLRNNVYKKLKEIAKEKDKLLLCLNDYLAKPSLGRAPNVSFRSPVLCVLGTGPKVGKFTFQINLCACLEAIGYTVGKISTEPQGFLFGYQTVPLGNAVLLDYVPFEEQIEYLRVQIAKTQQDSNCDILLLGGQSGVVPYNVDIQTDYNALSSIISLLAAKPDGFILCISPTDEISYIKRTIQAIESFGYGKVFQCILTKRNVEIEQKRGIKYERINYLPEDKYQQLCQDFTNSLGISVRGFSTDEDIIQTIRSIQDYFSEGEEHL